MKLSIKLAGASIAIALMTSSPAALAQTASTLSANLTNVSPTLLLPSVVDSNPHCFGPSVPYEIRHYSITRVVVSANGTYRFQDTSPLTDGFLRLHRSPIDPANLFASCVATIDSLNNAVLTAGAYDLVMTTRVPGEIGLIRYSVDGPGSIAAPAPAPIPTLSEWAMILFALILAAGATLTLHRRRLA